MPKRCGDVGAEAGQAVGAVDCMWNAVATTGWATTTTTATTTYRTGGRNGGQGNGRRHTCVPCHTGPACGDHGHSGSACASGGARPCSTRSPAHGRRRRRRRRRQSPFTWPRKPVLVPSRDDGLTTTPAPDVLSRGCNTAAAATSIPIHLVISSRQSALVCPRVYPCLRPSLIWSHSCGPGRIAVVFETTVLLLCLTTLLRLSPAICLILTTTDLLRHT